jgi:hypothetical protein
MVFVYKAFASNCYMFSISLFACVGMCAIGIYGCLGSSLPEFLVQPVESLQAPAQHQFAKEALGYFVCHVGFVFRTAACTDLKPR